MTDSENPEAPPNERALYVRTDIDTAEEIARLRDALETIACRHVTIAPLWWQKKARAALSDIATEAAMQTPTDEGQACDAGDGKYNPAAEIIPNGAETTKSDAGDVRRRALEEAAQAAEGACWKHGGSDEYSAGMDFGAYHQARECAAAIRTLISTPPQPAPTVQEATPTVEAAKRVIPTDAEVADVCMSMRHDFGLLGEVDKTVLRREALDWLFAWRRALSQQEGGE